MEHRVENIVLDLEIARRPPGQRSTIRGTAEVQLPSQK
jgi:hypothetical protein